METTISCDMAQETLTPGYFYTPSKRSRKGNLADFLSVVAFEAGCVLNRDGSLAIGFELSLPQEETLESFETLIHEFSAAAKSLPLDTALQKLDVYWEATSTISIPEASSFFHRKTLEHQEGKPIVKHRSWLFLRFFSQPYTPATTLRRNPDPWQETSWKQQTAQAACAAFLEAMPSTLGVRRLSQEEQEQLLFQYMSLTFHRPTQGFERALVRLPDRLAMGLSLKGVTMTGQAEEVSYNRQNSLGLEGVSSPFLWPVTHLARFPHIVCQHIELIDDKKWRKHKNLAFDFSAQLQIQARPRALAIHRQEQLMALEKLLNEHDTRLVKLHFSVLTWHTDTAFLQKHTDQLKSALGKAGLEVAEAAEDTDTLFFANAPGATGFLEGCHMPLETAVAYMPFITPRRGDEQGIYLQDRHGTPICYDPFKYRLDNQHVFLFGPSGSGKSFFNGKMIKDRYEAGHTVVVMDSGGTYRFLFQALAGTYIEYNPEQPLRLNPFLVKPKAGKYRPDTDKVAFLAHFLAKMWKGDLNKSPLSEVEYALLAKFLTAYYEGLQPGTIPHLADFCAWLQGHLQQEEVEKDLFDARNFFIVLAPFTKGIYKDHFNALEVEYLQDSKLLCFELEAVKSDRKLYPLVVQVLFDYILSTPAHAGPIAERLGIDIKEPAKESKLEKFFKKGAKSALKYIPGGEAVSGFLGIGGDLAEKVDRIEAKQATSLDQLREIARKALDTKKQVEEMYYFKRQSQQRAEELARGLKQSKPRKLLGVLLEDILGFPINPADYIPDTAPTRDLKKNLENDMALERDLIQRGSYFLSDTRAALAEQGLERQAPGQFIKAYQRAEAYEAQVLQALQAKRQATLKLYQEEIKRLDKEIALLEKAKEKKGLTVSDMMQIEQTIELKRGVVRVLHEKVTAGIAQEMELTEAQEAALLEKKMTSDTDALEAYVAKERQKIRQKYGHLWKFW